MEITALRALSALMLLVEHNIDPQQCFDHWWDVLPLVYPAVTRQLPGSFLWRLLSRLIATVTAYQQNP